MKTIQDLQDQAVAIRQKYDILNQRKRGVTWNGQQLMAGFVGDVGDLSKIIMAKHGLRAMEDIDQKLAHELADCLWSVLVLAQTYGVDVSAAFEDMVADLHAELDTELHGQEEK